jgi:putative intracellular protease/amidase
MKEKTTIITEAGLTRRHFVKCGAGAILAASCLPTLQRSAAILGATQTQAATGRIYLCPPCGQPCDKLTFDKPGVCPGCGMTLIEKEEAEKSPTVSILLFDHVEIIDFAGPWEVFGGAGYKVFTVAEKTEPINAVYGQRLVADYTFENSPKADVLLVPGGGVRDATNNAKLIKWVQDNTKDSPHVMSVCTGAFILARAGLLDGLTATTVRGGIDQLGTAGKNIKTVYDQRYVDNGKIITTAGLSSGIDGALYLVAKMLGKAQAQKVALGIEYNWDPEGRFVRAAFADRYLPNFQGFEAREISVEGNTERWELSALVSKPTSVAEIIDLTQKQVVDNTPHTSTPVVVLPRKKANELQWKFTDERGRKWLGSQTVQPSAEAGGKFVATVRLIRV